MRASGFAYQVRKSGEVVVTHDGKPAAALRGIAARRFLERIAREEPQRVMASITGNYRRGNERRAAVHPRNSPS
jgi:antitoxin (DNA-binding transcriptional repressor) of toxin-antitoxin stability system